MTLSPGETSPAEVFDLVTISERFMEIVNPTIPEKLLTVGKFLRLREGSRVIDFG